MGPIYPNLQTDIVPRAALNQKVAWNQKIIFLGDLQVLFYARPKNSKLFIANLEMDPFWGILTTSLIKYNLLCLIFGQRLEKSKNWVTFYLNI